MENREYLRKPYKNFTNLVEECTKRELQYFVLDACYSGNFNRQLKGIVESIGSMGKTTIEAAVLFNTDGEIAIISAELLGKFIGYTYTVSLLNYYKVSSLNRIAKAVVNGSEKGQRDFIAVSYEALIHCLKEMYSEIKYRKELLESTKAEYGIRAYNNKDRAHVVISILILEDICSYLGIKREYLTGFIKSTLDTKKI